MKKSILFFITSCFLFACNTDSDKLNYTYVKDFPDTRKLEGEIMNTLEYYTLSNLQVIDTLLILTCVREDSYLHVYGTESEKLMGEFSRRGRGPGEFLGMGLVNTVSGKDSMLLHAFDNNNRSITKVDILKSIQESDYIYNNEKLSIPSSNMRIGRIYFLSEELIIFQESEGPSFRFSIHEIASGERIDIPNVYPENDYLIRKGDESNIFRSCITANPYLNRIAAAPWLIGQIDFFNLKGDYISTTMYCNPEKMKESLEERYYDKNHPWFNYSIVIKSDMDFIYALNYNYSYGSIPPKPGTKEWTSLPEPQTTGHTNELLVFDWNGKPVERLLFDRFVSGFTIDSNNRIIYALCPDIEGDPHIVKYRY